MLQLFYIHSKASKKAGLGHVCCRYFKHVSNVHFLSFLIIMRPSYSPSKERWQVRKSRIYKNAGTKEPWETSDWWPFVLAVIRVLCMPTKDILWHNLVQLQQKRFAVSWKVLFIYNFFLFTDTSSRRDIPNPTNSL